MLLSVVILSTLYSCTDTQENSASFSSADNVKAAPKPSYTPFAVAPTPLSDPSPLPTQTARQKELDQKEQKKRTAQIVSALPRVTVGTPRLIEQWDSLPMVFELEFSPDGSLLAAAGDDNGGYEGGVNLRSTADWKRKGSLPGRVDFAWSPNSRFLAITNKGVDIWDVRTWRIITNLADGSGIDGAGNKGGAGVFGPMIFSSDNSKITTLGEDPGSQWRLQENDTNTDASFARRIAVKIWNVSDGQRLKVRPGPWSFGTNNLALISDSPTEIDFATISSGSSVVSNTHPPIYLTINSPTRRLFGRRFQPTFPYAIVSIPVTMISGFAISGNAWVYGIIAINGDTGQETIRIFRTRDQRLLRNLKLPSERRITDIAFSPDAKTLAVAQDHPVEETIRNQTYGLIRKETNRSRVLIYRLNIKK